MMQLCKILEEFHREGFVHNCLRLQSVCVKVMASGPQVTLADFGLTLLANWRPKLDVVWDERSQFAPEICGTKNPGRCGWQSDAYSLGKLMYQLYGSKQLPPLLDSWYVRSQDVRQSERRRLD